MSKMTLEVSEEEMKLILDKREAEKPKLWEPSEEDNNYFTSFTSAARTDGGNPYVKKAGAYSATPEQAQQKLDRNITNNLIQTWVDEHGGYKWKGGGSNCFIYYDYYYSCWNHTPHSTSYNPSVIYMSTVQVGELITGLNNGTIDIGFKGIE